MVWRIPLSDLNYDESEEQAVVDVLRSRWLSMGPRTEEFEARVAAYLGVKHAIAVANCTCALELAYSAALRRLEAGPDREKQALAVVPSMTFVASSNAAICAGADVDICDIESPESPLMGVEQARELLEKRAGQKTILCAVHYGGFDCHSQPLKALANEFGAVLVEDAAHAIGGFNASGAPLGTVGDFGCYSFFSNKNLATGEGGLVVTNDEESARYMRLVRSHGMTTLTYERHQGRKHGYDVVEVGHNYRCTEITAALAIEQLKKLDEGNARRRELYRLYGERLCGVKELHLPFAGQPGAVERSACHILPLLCQTSELRDQVRAALDAAGIQSSHHYPPIESLSVYRQMLGLSPEELSRRNSFEYASRQMTLPLHPGLQSAQVEEICEVILRSLRGEC